MPGAYGRLIDLFEQRGKAAAKAVYRRPVIECARLWRRVLHDTCYIGVTGSAGKTTTKELLHAALASRFRCAKSDDSNNQLYSIARTLIATTPATRFLVQELGASQPGGFTPMLALLRPRVGVVTNIGIDHFTSFRTPNAVAVEKRTLIDALPDDGIAVLNTDDERVMGMAAGCRAQVITYGTQRDAQLRGEGISARWPQPLSLQVHWRGATAQVTTRLHGSHQSTAVMAAIATACALGVPLEQAATAVGQVAPLRGRMSAYTSNAGVSFLRDDWKAPLWSMRLALDVLADAQAVRKFIVLGTLSDYAGDRGTAYRRVVEQALTVADHVIVMGDRGTSVARRLLAAAADRLHVFEDVRMASAWLRNFLRAGDLVLLKGSHRADHLARLALALDEDVRCWRRRCGRLEFCDDCRLLREPMPESTP